MLFGSKFWSTSPICRKLWYLSWAQTELIIICLFQIVWYTGDDFWCTDPSGDPNGTFWLQGCHMVHCAYNSLWMGNFIHPDWDMFQSTHPCAEFHAASRAISGGPIYVSDCVGKHNFPLLKRLSMPDGSILRCEYYALPTRDCLFADPLHDGKTMLKIWNLNKVCYWLRYHLIQTWALCDGPDGHNLVANFYYLIFATVHWSYWGI